VQSLKLKIVRIGNSRAVLLPRSVLARYRIKTEVSAELRPQGILLKPETDDLLTWEETARAMAVEAKREFTAFERASASDGLAELDK
jgi:antitoxin component of MazEF toxin-antitoxin module